MGLYNNVPTFTYISATGITVTYNKSVYTVQSFYTNKKYIYWDSMNPTVLQASNTMPTRSLSCYLVLINDGGIAQEVPSTNEEFEINYLGDSSEAIKARVHALYENTEEFGDRFVAIEQDIDGIKQIVGSSEGDDLSIINRVSKLEQTVDGIGVSVEDIKKEYNDDKDIQDLRESLNSSIININSILGVFKSEITDYFSDNESSSEEKVKIETQLELLENAKADFDGYIDKVIEIAISSNQTQDVTSLNSYKDGLNTSHVYLKNIITSSMIDDIITPTELTSIIDSFARYNLRVSEVKNACDNIILLGLGGIITEELARIDVKSDNIKLSVSKIESDFKTDMSVQKIELEKQIGDVSSTLDVFKDAVNTVFKDGVLDEAEKQILSERMANIEKEKEDIDAKFISISEDENLSSNVKESLITIYNNYISQHNELKEKIDFVISDDMVNDAEKLEVDTLFKKYSNSLSAFSVIMASAIEDIAFNKARKELEKAKDELRGEIDEIKDSISDLDFVIDGTFENNILDEVERQNIEANLESLLTEKIDIDNTYLNIYESEYLSDDDKIVIKEAYDNFVESYEGVKDVSNSILNKETLIDDIDKANLSKAVANYRDKLNLFFMQANASSEILSNNKSNALKDDFKKEIDEVNTKIDSTLEILEGSLKEDILEETKSNIIEESISNLEKEKMDVDAKYESIYNNEKLDGEAKENLYNAKVDFDDKIKNVIDTILNMVSDSVITDEEKEEFNLVREEFNLSSAELNKRFEEASNFITEIIVDETKTSLEKEINDLNNSLNGLEEVMNGAFLDGVLSESEKLAIKQHLLTLSNNKADIDVQYATINANKFLDGEVKDNLVASYNGYIESYNNLVITINNVLNKNTIIDDNDRNNLNDAFNSHNESLATYTERAIQSLTYIAEKKAEEESEKVDKKYAEIILDPETGIVSKVEHINNKISGNGGLEQRIQSAEEVISPDGITQIVSNIDYIKDMQNNINTNTTDISKIDQKADSINLEVSKKVGADKIISAINQSAESITISAKKINLSGYVTFTELGEYVTEDDLGQYGTTTIHGNRIATDSIQVNKLSSNNEHPIIRLFGNCALDATKDNNQGQGTAVRLKWSDYTYIRVGEDDIQFYTYSSERNTLFKFSGGVYTQTIATPSNTFTINSSGLHVDKGGFNCSGTMNTTYLSATGNISTPTVWSNTIYNNGLIECNSLGGYTYSVISMKASLDGNGYNLGYSGSRFQQLSCKNVYADYCSNSDIDLKENIRYLESKNNTKNIQELEVIKPNADVRDYSQEDLLTKEDLYKFISDEINICEYNYIKEEKCTDDFVNKIGFIANNHVDTKVGSKIVDKTEGDYYSYNVNNLLFSTIGALQYEVEKRDEENRMLKDRIAKIEEKLGITLE